MNTFIVVSKPGAGGR